MDINKLTDTVETTGSKSADFIKPISEIAHILSNEYLKKIELNQYCKIIESDLNAFQKKIQTLTSDKNESTRIKAEYKSRNKINITNSKSFRQALNELYKYKAELKYSYLATEKALRLKKMKYNRIISAYDSAWKEALKSYTSDPVFVELLEIQQENILLEGKIEKQEKLNACLENEFIQLKENVEKAYVKKVVEFSKAVIEYKEFSTSENRIKATELIKVQNSERTFEFSLFKENMAQEFFFKKNSFGFDNNDETNITCNVDVSMFDDMMVPSENLESQSFEDDGYSFMQNGGKHLDVSKDQDDDLEYLNNYKEKTESQNREAANLKVDSEQENSKAARVEENESQYFKQQALAPQQTEDVQPTDSRNLTEASFNKQKHTQQKSENNLNGGGRTSNSINNKSTSSVEQIENEDVLMECEESVSERSYANQKESYECHYRKTSSVSSDDLISNEDNQNESAGPSYKTCGDEQNNFSKPTCETEKNDFKSFAGFFTMGNDHETPTPSIFKLF